MNNIVNSHDNSILGENIRSIRKSLNLTQEEFAEKLNIGSNFLSKVENGKVGISLDTAIEICRISNCSSSTLFSGVIDSSNTPDNYILLTKEIKL